ncbi:hypothetical protein [Cohnella lubricantis]|uniref:Uncharacterized protein n=1 Tax=Cohnella lubricantis TaxID=2163172 RepID=A0A841TLL9_9BACL|nr:hypothetical protein [Cohnella lubricantis]MBB6679441.1 hypothetical protein [Cohnella lubricantis]MBP2118178.1 hypothetical protein [Cohnella lubricantis]
MPERTLFAYFNTPDQAKRAVEQIKSLRLIDYAIDRFDGYSGTGMQNLDQLGQTITGNFRGLGYLTMGADTDNPDTAPLLAASVSASGMSSGGPDNRVTGRDIMLCAIVEAEDYDRAWQIAQEAGAL